MRKRHPLRRLGKFICNEEFLSNGYIKCIYKAGFHYEEYKILEDGSAEFIFYHEELPLINILAGIPQYIIKFKQVRFGYWLEIEGILKKFVPEMHWHIPGPKPRVHMYIPPQWVWNR
jgi:hypothetical protein